MNTKWIHYDRCYFHECWLSVEWLGPYHVTSFFFFKGGGETKTKLKANNEKINLLISLRAEEVFQEVFGNMSMLLQGIFR